MLKALGGTLAASVVSTSQTSTAFVSATTNFIVKKKNGLHWSGDIWYHDAVHHTSTKLIFKTGRVAWLPKNDHFFNMLTIQETLELAAFLQLPKCQ
jgi:ABC-type branched-subunit amino acid transport system ATPase component